MSTKRLEFLREKYPQISQEDFNTIIAIDNSPTKKNSDWLLRLYANKKLDLQNTKNISEFITLYDGLKDEISIELRDINKFSSIEEFLFAFNKWLVSRFQENEKNTNYLRKGAELVFENDDVFIVRLLSHEGSVNYGSNTSWCTLKLEDYVRYAKSGPLFIVTCKTAKYTKVFTEKTQISVSNFEFRNRKNDEVDLIKAISANIELYKPFKNIFYKHGFSGSTEKLELIRNFFNLESCTPEKRNKIIEQYGLSLIKTIENLDFYIISSLFEHFGERVYVHIPEAPEKNKAFVGVVKEGLESLLKKGIKIDSDTALVAVESFPTNIVFIPDADESLWRYSIRNEPWLISISPFYKNKNVEEIMGLVVDNPVTLNHFKSEDFIPEDKRYVLAVSLLENSCENYIQLISNLKIIDEKFQLALVEKNYTCIECLENPSTIVKDKAQELKKIADEEAKAKKIAAKEASERKKKEIKNPPSTKNEWEKILKPYIDQMEWDPFEDDIPIYKKDYYGNSFEEKVLRHSDGTYEVLNPDGHGIICSNLEEANKIYSYLRGKRKY